MSRHDVKYEHTHQLIRSVYMRLCRETGSSRVSVSTICRAADINRGTFYLHFETIDHLLAELELEFARTLIDAWSDYQFDKDTERIYDRIFENVARNEDLFYFHFHFSDGSGTRIYEQYVEQIFIPQWMKHSNLTEKEARIVMIGLIRGNYGILEHWVNCGLKDRDTHRRLYKQVMEHGLYGLVYLDADKNRE